jgi:hypothetical protein
MFITLTSGNTELFNNVIAFGLYWKSKLQIYIFFIITQNLTKFDERIFFSKGIFLNISILKCNL